MAMTCVGKTVFQMLWICIHLVAVIGTKDQKLSGLTTVLTYSGSFQIRVDGKIWFVSATPFIVSNGLRYGLNNSWSFKDERPAIDKTLVLLSAEQTNGKDLLGTYKKMAYRYYADSLPVDLHVRAYDTMVVFSQTFPNGLKNPGIPDDRKVLSGFPAFQWDIVFRGNTASNYLTFVEELRGDGSIKTDQWLPWSHAIPDGKNSAGPLCLFNASSQQTVIISPLTQVLNLSPWHRYWKLGVGTEGQSYWGADRELDALPPGFHAEILLLYSPLGINKAFEDWGAALQLYHNRTIKSKKLRKAPVLDSLGYWTGPGSYYYNNANKLETYEDILLDVKSSADNQSVPIQFMELDNWWYESISGSRDGVVTWDANNQSLRGGLRKLQEKLGLPLAALCGWWSSNTTYAKQNSGHYSFIIEGSYALPIEEQFWTDLFKNASSSNISHIYFDNMTAQYFGISALQKKAGLAADWFRNMSHAADLAGITISFGGVLPRMLLATIEFPSIVQVRVSNNYKAQNQSDQWKIGVTSKLVSVLGLAAFKDTFWSHSHELINSTYTVEPYPVLHGAVSTLSMGAVVLGDGQGFLSSDIIKWCCTTDGIILRPSHPASAINAQLLHEATHDHLTGTFGQIWTTISSVQLKIGNKTLKYTSGILLGAEIQQDYNVTLSAAFPLDFVDQHEMRVWSIQGENQYLWQPFSDDMPLPLSTSCWQETSFQLICLYHVIPALFIDERTFLHICGESKFVPLSAQRVHQIMVSEENTTLTLQGQPGENVVLTYYLNDQRRELQTSILQDGTVTVTLNLTSQVPLSTKSPTITTRLPTTTTSDSNIPGVCSLLIAYINGVFCMAILTTCISWY